MRATRNRVYGVTRIGGSNPSSSASLFERTLRYSVFFLYLAVLRALLAVDFTKLTMVSSF